jgi:hypothetical protein
VTTSLVLTPNPKFDQANQTLRKVNTHPRSRSMCIDQTDCEVQQLSYWWLVVDQVVDQLHGEGMRLQEQLEQLGARQQNLEQLLHGMDQLRQGDQNNYNMRVARCVWCMVAQE